MEREENAAEPQNHLYMCTACTVVRMVHVFFSPAAFLYGSLEQFNSPESPNPFAVSDIDIVAYCHFVGCPENRTATEGGILTKGNISVF